LQTSIRRDEEAMDIFYELHLKTRRRQGVPIQPRSYFRRFHQRIVRANLAFVSITGDADRPMSAAIFCDFAKTLLYKYGASDPAYSDRGANHLMFWDTMLHARSAGSTRFHFGKTARTHEGLRAFKKGWNAVERPLAYSYFPGAASSALFELLNRHVVAPIIRRTPTFVCRAAGEMLYRRFGA
jgi:lipid II:glycine glycyltransferase (peptidoglycan interpeptide bridge formation enzyme)